jgi:hypothetical protein
MAPPMCMPPPTGGTRSGWRVVEVGIVQDGRETRRRAKNASSPYGRADVGSRPSWRAIQTDQTSPEAPPSETSCCVEEREPERGKVSVSCMARVGHGAPVSGRHARHPWITRELRRGSHSCWASTAGTVHAAKRREALLLRSGCRSGEHVCEVHTFESCAPHVRRRSTRRSPSSGSQFLRESHCRVAIGERRREVRVLDVPPPRFGVALPLRSARLILQSCASVSQLFSAGLLESTFTGSRLCVSIPRHYHFRQIASAGLVMGPASGCNAVRIAVPGDDVRTPCRRTARGRAPNHSTVGALAGRHGFASGLAHRASSRWVAARRGRIGRAGAASSLQSLLSSQRAGRIGSLSG